MGGGDGFKKVSNASNEGLSLKKCISKACAVWPDLAKFRHFGKILQVFGQFLKILGKF